MVNAGIRGLPLGKAPDSRKALVAFISIGLQTCSGGFREMPGLCAFLYVSMRVDFFCSAIWGILSPQKCIPTPSFLSYDGPMYPFSQLDVVHDPLTFSSAARRFQAVRILGAASSRSSSVTWS